MTQSTSQILYKRTSAAPEIPFIGVEIREGIAVREWFDCANGVCRSAEGTAWGCLGLTEKELRVRGFTKHYPPR